jgi:hypothetical protein
MKIFEHGGNQLINSGKVGGDGKQEKSTTQ